MWSDALYGNQNEKFTYNMQEEGVKRDLVETKEEKDLGVIFDPTMTFTKHIGMVASKANRILGVIKRTFDYMDTKMFITLYKSMVRPHLEYANCIWNPILHKDSSRIESVLEEQPSLYKTAKTYPIQRVWGIWNSQRWLIDGKEETWSRCTKSCMGW